MAEAIDGWLRRLPGEPVVWKLLMVNAAVFVTLRAAGLAAMLMARDVAPIVDALALPQSLDGLMHRPWTLLTYMFTQYDILHIFFNMLTLYWFGSILARRCASWQVAWLYIYGGVAGAAAFIAAAAIFKSVDEPLVGASASVMAIVIASAVTMPYMRVRLFLIGSVKLKWVALVAIALFALGLIWGRIGPQAAHLGGIVMGLIFGLCLNRLVDITRPANKAYEAVVAFIKSLTPARRKPRLRPTRAQRTAPTPDAEADRRELDAILDKIRLSGYTALTADEKRRLFEVSSRVK